MTAKEHRGRAAVRTEEWLISLDGESYPVQVSFKKMKTVRLRIVAGGQIRLSAPKGIDRHWLEQFLRERQQWILKHMELQKNVPAVKHAENTPLTVKERREALAYLMPMVERWYPIVAAYGVPIPHVTVRRMSSRYGSCSVGRGRITLAEFLLHVPKDCAE